MTSSTKKGKKPSYQLTETCRKFLNVSSSYENLQTLVIADLGIAKTETKALNSLKSVASRLWNLQSEEKSKLSFSTMTDA